jgi:type 2 lantibiotic biosynthesis protein LanM
MDRLERLDEEEIELQCGLIRLSFKHRPRETWHPSPWPSADGGWSAEHAIERATALGEVIARYAIERDDGAAWLGIVAVGQEERLQYDTAGFDLYAGSGGIAVFLAALFRVTGRAAFRDLSQRALLPMVELAHQRRQASLWARALGVGGAVGLGSMIYSLVRVAELAELPQLRHDARIVTELLTPELIGADTTFDVIDGSAGAILGLLALAATGEASALAKAIECGRHLLSVGREKLLPPSCPTPHLGGFAHGASGIAYSLQRLAEASRDLAFARAAARWVDAERRLFDARAGNWVDLRFSKDGVNSFSCNWCHGAVGVGLARLGVELVDTAAMHEIDIALTTTRDHAMGVRDHLCCGNFGRLELLLTAGTKLHRPDLVALARDRAATRLHANRDGFAWVLGTDSDNPGFFQGISGIGYQLLRLARPHELPSILLWH